MEQTAGAALIFRALTVKLKLNVKEFSDGGMMSRNLLSGLGASVCQNFELRHVTRKSDSLACTSIATSTAA